MKKTEKRQYKAMGGVSMNKYLRKTEKQKTCLGFYYDDATSIQDNGVIHEYRIKTHKGKTFPAVPKEKVRKVLECHFDYSVDLYCEKCHKLYFRDIEELKKQLLGENL